MSLKLTQKGKLRITSAVKSDGPPCCLFVAEATSLTSLRPAAYRERLKTEEKPMRKPKFPPGRDKERVEGVFAHYESQTEEGGDALGRHDTKLSQ